ncbi:UNVERIFIED_CONTAM: hypothetical protein HHA_449320 [Hammondia hammondi]|eukprot:XP_008881960.1 hypothetical protein HHA_449320 [Hammondia hammondi]
MKSNQGVSSDLGSCLDPSTPDVGASSDARHVQDKNSYLLLHARERTMSLVTASERLAEEIKRERTLGQESAAAAANPERAEPVQPPSSGTPAQFDHPNAHRFSQEKDFANSVPSSPCLPAELVPA